MFDLLPNPSSDFAYVVDVVHGWLTILSLFFTVAVVGTMLYFAVKYRQKGETPHPTPHIEGSTLLEIIWTVLPVIICVLVAGAGYVGFEKIRNTPTNEPLEEIIVTGQKWSWGFKYKNGKETTGELVVPVGKAIKLILTSRDVIHSFYIPGMRVKMDAVPQKLTTAWFRPIKTGTQQVYCTEYCGTAHSNMMASLRVIPQGEYERWLSDKGRIQTPEEEGKQYYAKYGCNGCHSLNGSPMVGPTFLNLFNKEGELVDGSKYVADEEYLRESILYSTKKVVKGYGPVMPVFEGQIKDEEILSLIAFIKSVTGEAAAPVEEVAVDTSGMSPEQLGEQIYKTKLCASCHSLDGSNLVGPSFKGLWGRSGKTTAGDDYVVDEGYLKESVLNPGAKVVQGYPEPSPMPPYQGQFNDADLNNLIAYIKSLK